MALSALHRRTVEQEEETGADYRQDAGQLGLAVAGEAKV